MSTQFRPEQADLTKYWDFGSGTMRVPAGTSFPAGPGDGDTYYRTDEDLLYIYDGAGWARIQNQAVDVAIEQVGSPTYEDVQDWINTTQSAGLISGGVGTATSYAIATADDVAETFTITGDVTAYFTNGVVFTVSGSTGNDGDYTTVGNSTFGGGVTTITVADVPDGTDDGNIADGRVDVALGAGMVKKTDDAIDGVTAFFDWPATPNILLVDNKVNWVYATYGGGTPAVAATDDHTAVDFTTEFVIFIVYREGTVLHIMQAGLYIFDAFRSMARRVRELRRIERASGAIISNEGTLKIKVTAAVLYSVMTRITTSEVDTSGAGRFRAWYHDGGGNWTSTGIPADQTDIDSANYDIGTGLAALAAARYGVYWVFLDFDSHLHVVYGVTSYKLHEAQAAEMPVIPDICSEFSVLVARVIAFKDAAEITEVASAFVTTFLVATAANYQDLANRGHDLIGVDHQDTLADTVVDGDVIIGNATPKWSRLPIAVPAANVRNVLGIDNGETRPSWKTALDAVNPANVVPDTAAPGTSLLFSHRDHVHGIANRTRKFLVQAVAAYNVTDSTDIVRGTLRRGWELADAKICNALAHFFLPSDYVSGLVIEAVINPDGPGDIFAQLRIGAGAEGEAHETHLSAPAYAAVALGGDVINAILGAAPAGVAVGDLLVLRFLRDATDVADTINSDVWFSGFLVSYTADS